MSRSMPYQSQSLSPDPASQELHHRLEFDDNLSLSPLPPSKNRVNFADFDTDAPHASDSNPTYHKSHISAPYDRSASASAARHQSRHPSASESCHRSHSHITISSDDPGAEARELKAQLARAREEIKTLNLKCKKFQTQMGTLSCVFLPY